MMKTINPKTEIAAPAARKLIRVCVVEDDEVVREQLEHQLKRAAGMSLAGCHRSAEQALAEIPREKPDVVLMDINLPKMSGIECVRELKSQMPSVQFIMLTIYEDAEAVFKSLLAGAVGYLLKGRTGSGEQIIEAINDACRGGSPLNSLIARKIVQHFHRQRARSGMEHPLSPRESEVLEHLSRGLTYKEIADMLSITMDTVRKHCHNIYEKLQVSSRTAAVVKFLDR